jgi:hypothetical protein
MDLYLRKVDHPQAKNSYRVVLRTDGEEFEIGSVGVQNTTGAGSVWHWGIDTVIPMRELESGGEGSDRQDCAIRFKAAWQPFCKDRGRLEEFLAAKRKRHP